MQTELQKNLPPSHLERGIECVDPLLSIAEEKPLVEMLIGFVDRLRSGEEVNIHEYCCGMGVATEQIQLLLNALCIAADVRARASVVGSDINPLHEERLYTNLELYHDIALDYLRSSNLPGVDVWKLRNEAQLKSPQARFVSASADVSMEHPGPLDFAFCVHGIWYIRDKLGHIFNAVESLRQGSGLVIWNALDLNSVRISHIKGGSWQGGYRLRNFLAERGLNDYRFFQEPGEYPVHALTARRTRDGGVVRPRFIRAVDAKAPSTLEPFFPWNYSAFRVASEYEFEE